MPVIRDLPLAASLTLVGLAALLRRGRRRWLSLVARRGRGDRDRRSRRAARRAPRLAVAGAARRAGRVAGGVDLMVVAAGPFVGLRRSRPRLPALRVARALADRTDARARARPLGAARRGCGLGATRQGACHRCTTTALRASLVCAARSASGTSSRCSATSRCRWRSGASAGRERCSPSCGSSLWCSPTHAAAWPRRRSS